jgi:hypothetical protein
MTHTLASDVQQGIVYGFENDIVERISPEFLSRDGIRDLVERASNLTGIQIPKLNFQGDRSWPCLANIRTWELTFSDWGRNPTTVLHEVAHLVTYDQPRGRMEMMQGQAHGPVFLRNAIDLYSNFIGVTRTDLETLARRFGLVVAPPLVEAPKMGDFFNEDF